MSCVSSIVLSAAVKFYLKKALRLPVFAAGFLLFAKMLLFFVLSLEWFENFILITNHLNFKSLPP